MQVGRKIQKILHLLRDPWLRSPNSHPLISNSPCMRHRKRWQLYRVPLWLIAFQNPWNQRNLTRSHFILTISLCMGIITMRRLKNPKIYMLRLSHLFMRHANTRMRRNPPKLIPTLILNIRNSSRITESALWNKIRSMEALHSYQEMCKMWGSSLDSVGHSQVCTWESVI